MQLPILQSKVLVETSSSCLALDSLLYLCDYILQHVIISLVQPPKETIIPPYLFCRKELTCISSDQTYLNWIVMAL